MPKCNALTNHMCITVKGEYRPCCRFQNFPSVNVSQTTFHEYKTSDFYQNIIKDMETGWASGCIKCKTEEEHDHFSLRMRMNEEYSGIDQVEYLELSLSNECNLICRMCSPHFSTKWNTLVSENQKIKKYQNEYKQPYIDVDQIFSNIDLSKLKAIKYLGGEPFITSQVKDLLFYLDKNNLLENINFIFNTNATYFPYKFLKYFDKFKGLKVELSIDGIGSVNEYIRHGKSWKSIEENVKKWIEYRNASTHIMLVIHTTVQAYNFHDLGNIKKFADSLNVKMHGGLLQVPEYLSVNTLPNKYIEEVTNQYNEKFLPSVKYNGKFHELIKYTNDMDSTLDTDIESCSSLLKKYMEEYNGL